MKNWIAVILLASLTWTSAHAAEGKKKKMGAEPEQRDVWAGRQKAGSSTHHRMAGCGLGSMIISDDGTLSQVGASLLNGTGFQSLAIAFGTSNCTKDGLPDSSHEKQAFIETNFLDLKHDIAIGSGEYVTSLASLYGCNGEASENFAKKLHGAQSEIIKSSASESFEKINTLMVSDKNLVAACRS